MAGKQSGCWSGRGKSMQNHHDLNAQWKHRGNVEYVKTDREAWRKTPYLKGLCVGDVPMFSWGIWYETWESRIAGEPLTLTKNFLFMFLAMSAGAALSCITPAIISGSGGSGSVDEVHASWSWGQGPVCSWPQEAGLSKGLGHLSSGLDPSSLFLALQRIREREIERSVLDLRLFALFCRSIADDPVLSLAALMTYPILLQINILLGKDV